MTTAPTVDRETKSPEISGLTELATPSYVKLISGSAEFKQELISLRRNPHVTRENFPQYQAIAVSNAAEQLALNYETRDGLSVEGHALTIMSQLRTFADSLVTLKQLQANDAYYREKKPHLHAVTSFNHAVQHLLADNPNFHFATVMTFLSEANLSINGPKNRALIQESFRDILSGMQQELGAKQITDAMDGVVTKDVTVEEDMAGADRWISIDGSDFFKVDWKSSPSGVQRALDKARRHNNPDTYPVWTQVHDDEFNNTFMLSDDIVAERAEPLRRELLAIAYQTGALKAA